MMCPGPLQGHSSDSDSAENLIPSSKMTQWEADFRRTAAHTNNSRGNTIRERKSHALYVHGAPLALAMGSGVQNDSP